MIDFLIVTLKYPGMIEVDRLCYVLSRRWDSAVSALYMCSCKTRNNYDAIGNDVIVARRIGYE